MSIRLRDLCPWVQSWAMDCLFAGTCAPSGADDAWYETALEIELAKLLNAALTGGGADIYKCFDQISLAKVVSLPNFGMHTAPSISMLFTITR